ncbi:hypothetical protein Tco_0712642, partial [Tanacetum coccineum]
MALNPQLYGNGMPVAFVNEMFVLIRDGIDFEVNNIYGAHGGTVKAKGKIFLSNVRMVFVADKPTQILDCFRTCPWVVPYDQNRAMYPAHSFKIMFKNGDFLLIVVFSDGEDVKEEGE